MTAQPTHWMTYGEPVGDGRVAAEHRTTYATGPNETRADDVRTGTLPMDALEIWDESEHVHDDGSLCLSAMDDDARERLEAAFEPAGIEVTCESRHHDEGGHTWTYGGNREPGERVSCPRCGSSVRLPER